MMSGPRAGHHTTATAIDGSFSRRRTGRWIAGGLAIAFGLATLVEGGHVLFGEPRAAEGNVVPFVVQFNFVAGFGYVLGGAATVLGRRWAAWIAWVLVVATLAVFVAFGVRVLTGGSYEARTVVAMVLRSGFWVAQAVVLPGLLKDGSGR